MVRWLSWHCPPDTGFEIWALAVWGRARYLSVTEAPHNTNFHTWMGKKHFCFFQTAETGNRTPNSGVKGSGANHYPRAPAQHHALCMLRTEYRRTSDLCTRQKDVRARCTNIWSTPDQRQTLQSSCLILAIYLSAEIHCEPAALAYLTNTYRYLRYVDQIRSDFHILRFWQNHYSQQCTDYNF